MYDSPYKRSHRSAGYVMFLFLISNIYDMSGKYSIKYVSIALIIIYVAINTKKISIKESELVMLTSMFIIWPLFSIFHGTLQGFNIQSAISTNYIMLFIVIYFLFSQFTNPIAAFDQMNAILLTVAVLVIVVNLTILILPSGTSLTGIISKLADNYDEYYGVRPDSMIVVPRIYFRVTLFFTGGFAYSIFKKYYLFSGIYLAALILSYSRGGLLVCFFIFLLFSTSNIKQMKTIFIATAIILITIYFNIYYYSPRIIEHLEGLLTSASYTIRIDHITNLNELWNDNIYNFLLGSGSGSSMNSNFYGFQISNIEMSQLETIRRYGLVWSLVLFTLMGYIMYNSRKYLHPSIAMSLIAIFLATFTNPILQSPLFAFFYITAYREYKQETIT